MSRFLLIFGLFLNSVIFGAGFASTMMDASIKLHKLDKDFMTEAKINETKSTKLFSTIEKEVPQSYKLTLDLAKKFNPKPNTNDSKNLKKEISAYLAQISKLDVIKYALESTNTTIKDLEKNWFGPGRAFEHVFCGELKGSKVSGYHFWYKFYKDEIKGYTEYTKTIEGKDDPAVFTGAFTWDPDGPGKKFKKAYKRKGGFSIGSSAPAIMALGHIAMENNKKGNSGSSPRFRAKLNGSEYNWQLYTMAGSIRSLFPMVIKGKFNKLYSE